MDTTEIELVQRAQNGDHNAFDKLVARHDKRVFQVIYGMVGNLQDTQDIYQETFIRAYTKISTFRFQSEFSTWVTRIAINQSINHRRQRRVKKWFTLHNDSSHADDYAFDLPIPEKEEPAQKLLNKEFLLQLQGCLKNLPTLQKAAFTMKHFQGYKIKEIAEILDCAEGTVKNAIFRAAKKLKNDLR